MRPGVALTIVTGAGAVIMRLVGSDALGELSAVAYLIAATAAFRGTGRHSTGFQGFGGF